MGSRLLDKRITLFVEEGFEDTELIQARNFFFSEGARISIVGSGRFPTFRGKHGAQVAPDTIAAKVSVDDFDAIIVLGGYATEKMRLCQPMVRLVAQADDHGKILCAIGHGPQLLISADVLRDRMVTGYHTITIDMRNAGAQVVDEPVVIDGNLITSREAADLPHFLDAIAETLFEQASPSAQPIVAGA
jgi:protease I